MIDGGMLGDLMPNQSTDVSSTALLNSEQRFSENVLKLKIFA